jgi:hypothetical protein
MLSLHVLVAWVVSVLQLQDEYQDIVEELVLEVGIVLNQERV